MRLNPIAVIFTENNVIPIVLNELANSNIQSNSSATITFLKTEKYLKELEQIIALSENKEELEDSMIKLDLSYEQAKTLTKVSVCNGWNIPVSVVSEFSGKTLTSLGYNLKLKPEDTKLVPRWCSMLQKDQFNRFVSELKSKAYALTEALTNPDCCVITTGSAVIHCKTVVYLAGVSKTNKIFVQL